MNKGIIVGRIVRDLELRYTLNGKPACELVIACNNTKDDTTFLRTNVYSKMAQTICEYCKKGDLLGVEYIVKNNNWEDKNGVKHYEYSFIANRVTFLAKNNKTEKQIDENMMELTDEDLPFD